MRGKRLASAGMFLPAALAGALSFGTHTAGSRAALLEPPVCTAAQLAGTREGIPLSLQDLSDDSFPDSNALASLVSGRRYAVVVDETRATREATATEGFSAPVRGSVRVSGPAGLVLTPLSKNYTDYYAFKTAAAGRLAIQATWQQEVGSKTSSATVFCSAAATLDVAVVATKFVLTRARFYAGFRFEVRVLNQVPPDPRPVTALLRVRRGVAAAPRATGPAAKSITFNPLHVGPSSITYSSGLRLHFGAESAIGGASVQVDADGNIPFGTQSRFGFSVELRQGGRRVGGMRSGVICKRVQLATHSEARCTHPGFAAQP